MAGHGRWWMLALVCGLGIVVDSVSARGGDLFRRRGTPPGWTPTSGQRIDPANPAPAPGLGTFYPNPQAMLGANDPLGPGFSPLQNQVSHDLTIYGPLSAFRATSVPVTTYTRGYDGRVYPTRATSFAYPNFPELSPYTYPTQMTRQPGFPYSQTPPWWPSARNWIDQN